MGTPVSASSQKTAPVYQLMKLLSWAVDGRTEGHSDRIHKCGSMPILRRFQLSVLVPAG